MTNSEKKKQNIFRAAITDIANHKCLYLMALPVILYYAVFCYAPMYGAIIAFKRYDVLKGIIGSEWVGLKYFKEFFTGVYFVRILRNTLIISGYELLVGFPLPIIFALLMNELKSNTFKKSVQTVTYLPHFISNVVICGMIVDFFGTNGIVTQLLAHFGLPKINYVGANEYFRHVYVWTDVWKTIGWSSIIYIASLAGVDPSLYEAARIDGASRFKQAIHVTLPGISSTVVVMLILRIGKIMSLGYEKIILLYGPATYETADIISSFVYRYGLTGMKYSYSTAVGLFQSVINLILIVAANKISKKVTDMGIY